MSLDPIEKGVILTIDETGKGTIKEPNGTVMEFQQDYAKELGLAKDMKVRYSIVNVDGKYFATSLKTV